VVFGDFLQGVFGFAAQIVDWESDVYPTFPREATLTRPHRWINAKNTALAEWLKCARSTLELGKPLDLSAAPPCVRHVFLPQSSAEKQKTIRNICLGLLEKPQEQNIIVLHDAAAPEIRARLARDLAKRHFQNVEPLDCKPLSYAARQLDASSGPERLEALLRFTGECMTGTHQAEMNRAVESALGGGARGHKAHSHVLPALRRVHDACSREAMLEFLDLVAGRSECCIYRREMLWAMRVALQAGIRAPDTSLEELVWDVQNNVRHAGRRFARSSVASILLAKGLEFDHSVVVHASKMTNKDWYVALTRATRSVRVISPETQIIPAEPSRTKEGPRQASFHFD
jgi:DNA helicase-2/ATP-dependent DNA helicase PcrA